MWWGIPGRCFENLKHLTLFEHVILKMFSKLETSF
jgi:hypothetical protein